IPKLGYYASNLTDDIRDAIMEIYVHNISQDGANFWSWEVPEERENQSKITTNFIFDYERYVYVTCYSTNLRIYSKEEVETTIFDGTFHSKHILNSFDIEIREDETVYPWTVQQIMLNIHSPFDPVYPFYEGEYLQLGHTYFINIRIILYYNSIPFCLRYPLSINIAVMNVTLGNKTFAESY
ncbi:hypothetical protein NPIL_10491, partial [Nephila pilipes]